MPDKKNDKPQKLPMVTKSTILILLLIGFIATIEYGPPAIPLVEGPSPFNSGSLGTSKLAQTLASEGYNVIPVTNWTTTANILRSCNNVLIIIISPEIPYSVKDLTSIKSVISSCSNVSFIIADEGPHTNTILSMVGSRIQIVSSKRILEPTGDPYPYATLKTPSNYVYYLRLDKAAPLDVKDGEIMGISEGLPVAAYQILNKSKVYALGDGSIFLNQVLELPANVSSSYRNFIVRLVNDLTTPGSTVLIEASKYIATSNPQELTLQNSLNVLNNPELFLLLLSRIIHPRFWAPPLFNIINTYLKNLLSSEIIKIIIVVVMIFIGYYIIARNIGKSVYDTKLEDTLEIDVIVDTQVRRTLLEKKAKFTKNDFTALYEIMDQIISKTVNVRINEIDSLIKIFIAYGINEKVARQYVNDMNKLYIKITKRKFRPVILSWNRKILQMINLSEMILNKFGSTLVGEKGVEYKMRYEAYQNMKGD
ncbi:MAG: hypothetical protein QW128_09030 [Thermoprotei archaeon]